MKNKRAWLLIGGFLVVLGIFVVAEPLSWAAGGIEFKPNVRIPGTAFDRESVEITGASLGKYIVALYSYGSIFAGFVAMFMLVYAGWQWLLAGGSLDKISRAKNTINGVLVGLALLFGGYLLMSQISDRLVNFDELNIEAITVIPGMEQACEAVSPTVGCGGDYTIENEFYPGLICISQVCPQPESQTCVETETGLPCPAAITSFDDRPGCTCASTNCAAFRRNNCEEYRSQEHCNQNTCLGETTAGGTFDKECGWNDGQCRNLRDINCDSNDDCNLDGGNDWCCDTDTVRGPSGGFDNHCRPRSEAGSDCATN